MKRYPEAVDVAIVGGGIAGLSAAWELRNRRPDLDFLVLERETCPGGRARTCSTDGYRIDTGPNGMVPGETTLRLLHDLGLDGDLRAASTAARRRYVYMRGQLHEVPTAPNRLLSSSLVSPLGKLRAVAEPLLGRRTDGEETVHRFAARHFGEEAARIASTAVLGIAAADGRDLSLDALFPRMRQLEREHGSLLRGMIKSRSKGAGAARRRLSSFPEGMGRLTQTLAENLSPRVHVGREVGSLAPASSGGYRLEFADGSTLAARVVVLALPAGVAAGLLRPVLPDVALPLEGIRSFPVDVVAMAFDRADVPGNLDGFGLLAARGEGVRTLGVLWESAIHEGRAPAGKLLLRAITGGHADPSFTELSDEEAYRTVQADLRKVMGIQAEPVEKWRVRQPSGIPHYGLGHRERVAAAMGGAAAAGGLVLAGDSYYGVGVNACVADAGRVADEADRQLS